MSILVLSFEKMHGLGNDFIILEKRHLPPNSNLPNLARYLCNRNFYIGADGLIIMDFSTSSDSDFSWLYYNCDGTEAEMCGNGMRCFAKYVYEKGLTDKTSFSVQTKAGIIKPSIQDDASITVNMGSPIVNNNGHNNSILISSKKLSYYYVEIGNPHCVIFVDDGFNDNEFFELGPAISTHNTFPKGVNVEFVNVVNTKTIKVKVWERGAGPTLACGTGACAALVAANLSNLVEQSAKVYLPGGILNVNWIKDKNEIYINGPATFVYTGQISLDMSYLK